VSQTVTGTSENIKFRIAVGLSELTGIADWHAGVVVAVQHQQRSWSKSSRCRGRAETPKCSAPFILR
jgi:hypothetical protein